MPDTVTASTSTTAILPLGGTVYGTIETIGDHDWYRVNLVQGQVYQIRVHGIGTGQLADPDITLRNASGVQIGYNDDGGTARWGGANGLDSFLEFTAPSSGVFFVDIGGIGANPTGDFMVTVVPRDASGDEVFTMDEIAWQLVNNYNEQSNSRPFAWNVGADGSLSINITALTAAGQTLAREALRAWTDITGIVFVETSGVAEITFDDNDAGVNAYANWSATGGFITSATVQITTGWLTQFGNTFNSYSFETYIHEIGHALGLGHGGNYNGSATFGVDNYYRNDSLAYSIMSYMQVFGDEFSGPNTTIDADFRHMLTPGIADSIAIRLLYGDIAAVRTGNTTYGYGSNTGSVVLDSAVGYGADMFMMITDDGGIDTLNFTGTSANQVIRLLGSEFSSNVLGGRQNLWIARGVVIENAYGGTGADFIAGNQANNTLFGNAGNDDLYGLSGTDTLVGGAGADRLDGGDGADYAFYGNSLGVNVNLTTGVGIGGEAQGDTLFNIEHVIGSAFGDILTGNALGNELVGGAGNDILQGMAGGDVLAGGDGVDTASYAASSDTVNVNLTNLAGLGAHAQGDVLVGIENLIGSAFGDLLRGDGANNTLEGGGGGDLMFGEAGADVLFGGDGGDVMTGGAGSDTFVFSSLDTASADIIIDFDQNGNDLLLFRNFGPSFDISDFQFSLVNGTDVLVTATDWSGLVVLRNAAGLVDAGDFAFA